MEGMQNIVHTAFLLELTYILYRKRELPMNTLQKTMRRTKTHKAGLQFMYFVEAVTV